MPPLISVLLPVHNGEDYIETAIESILKQTWPDLELLVLDDGSSDRTAELVKCYTDPRLHYFHHQQHGLAKTLNRGLSLARGYFIARQDADDESHPERLGTQIGFIQKHPDYVLLGTWARIADESGCIIGRHHHPCSNEALQVALCFGNPFVHSSVIFRREAALRVGAYPISKELNPPEDYALWTKLATEGKIGNIDKELVTYTQRLSGISQTRAKEIKENGVFIAAEYLKRTYGKNLGSRDAHQLVCYLHGKKLDTDIKGKVRLLGWPKLFLMDQRLWRQDIWRLLAAQWAKSALMQLPGKTFLRKLAKGPRLLRPDRFKTVDNNQESPRSCQSVTVVIATYKRPKKLREAIDSALSQTYDILEILVCEDGNTLECAGVVNRFCDSRVRHLPGDHSGLPAIPRNRGINAASGDWIAFLDDDDQWDKNKIERQLRLATRGNYSFVATISKSTCLSTQGGHASTLTFRHFLGGNPLVTSSVIVRRGLIPYGFDTGKKLRGLEDFHLWLQLATRTNCLLIQQPLVQYNINSSDSVRKRADRRSGAEELEMVLQHFLEEHQNAPYLSTKHTITTVMQISLIRLREAVASITRLQMYQ